MEVAEATGKLDVVTTRSPVSRHTTGNSVSPTDTSGRGNPGEEAVDEDFTFTKDRRRSNSTGYANNLNDFKTKFDVNEQEPVFEESVHGPDNDDDGEDLAKTETSESGQSSAADDDKVSK